MWWIVLFMGAVALTYVFFKRRNKYWLNKGVPQSNPVVIFGDSWSSALGKESLLDMVQTAYNMFPNARYSGVYQFLQPILLIRDLELIKQITVKDFEHFVDHYQMIPPDVDPLFSKNLFALNGQRWRDMRNTLSPAFTGSKMKFMFSLIAKSGQQFADYFLNEKQNIITAEMKDVFTRFTNDVIANTAFGVECDSLRDRQNEFFVLGKDLTNFNGFFRKMKLISLFIFPHVLKIFNVRFFPVKVADFFSKVINDNVASREKYHIARPDMLHLLLEAQKHGLKHEETEVQDTGFATVQESEIGKSSKAQKIEISDESMLSQALLFFFAGFDGVASLMCFMSYELALNPDIQDRLIQEIDDIREACQDQLTYEALTGMKYLDMVLCETLRKWPLGAAADRICTKPYTIEPQNPDEAPLRLEKNEVIWIPIYGIHRDPHYWPEPERFDPERFNDENKNKIVPYTYLPFGAGPRNCIGSRFALLETKALFFYLLSHFRIVPVEKTPIPLVISSNQINIYAKGGFWLGLKRRNEN